MTVIAASSRDTGGAIATTSKQAARNADTHNGHTEENPVIAGCEFVYENTDLVRVDESGVQAAAEYIHRKMLSESYSPQTWRTHPLHNIPDDTKPLHDPANVRVLDWIFLISSLNFSFWSEREGTDARYGVLWQESWASGKPKVFTGYWSLVAALNRASSEGTPITDPKFYADKDACPVELIAHVFRRAPQSKEDIPLLQERISIMRENGRILCEDFGGSFAGFINAFHAKFERQGTALDLVKMITETFPSFRDETVFEGRRVCIWKRAQILVAELWAAFFPDPSSAIPDSSSANPNLSSANPTSPATSAPPTTPTLSLPASTFTSTSTSTFTPTSTTTTTTSPTPPHPLFPGPRGPAIGALTMFADYRVPQVLHHLRILRYAPGLEDLLRGRTTLPHGSREEVALRAGSVLAVERVRGAIGRRVREAVEKRISTRLEHGTRDREGKDEDSGPKLEVSSVLIDFYLWDLAKRVESGAERIEGIETAEVLPAHRTRSIWY
uniref:Queuosine 5'-phosphate N-glycosylase/hydrolase n=1 Tax=Schizophyllum commune (strain H4-8 / FGSC 9210) TaxID=578458 RepID=D8PY05_SCHCM